MILSTFLIRRRMQNLCGGGGFSQDAEYDMGLHIGALFVILVISRVPRGVVFLNLHITLLLKLHLNTITNLSFFNVSTFFYIFCVNLNVNTHSPMPPFVFSMLPFSCRLRCLHGLPSH